MSKKIATVLIGTTLTEASDQVVRAGLKVARAAKARVVLAHAYPPDLLFGGAPYVPELPEVVEAEKENLRRKMEGQAHLLGIRPEERAGTFLEMGPAHQMLIATAQKTNADLIVVGAADSPILAKLLGSTADRVVRKATCPVLVVRRELPMPPARVLLPVDLSLLSAEALREGLEVLGVLARDHGSAATVPEVEALCVITDLDRHLFATEEAPERAEMKVREDMGHFLALHAGDSAFKVVPRIVSGCVEDEILLRIREWEPDLVVLGTHGRSGFERFLLGSVATRVSRDSGSNMLIVPPAAAREQAVAARDAIEQEVLVG
ncbi:MAG TPA: universal stress protein [Thermoanaerobaculia bacterium]|nr:universal stress protein [Thermoanaerobaculia bacterium]